jgi:MoaA/NifB/PqqE/SkfB family radical SAM enzyme
MSITLSEESLHSDNPFWPDWYNHRRRIDTKVTIELNLTCNVKCIFCSRNASPLAEGCPLSKGEVEEILVDAKKKGAYYVEFAGGEAVLDKNLPYYLQKTHELGMGTQLITNGLCFSSRKVCEEIVPQLDMLQLSIPCYDEETYERLMGTPGSFKRLQSALSNLKEYDCWKSLFIILLKSTLPFLTTTLERVSPFLLNLKNVALMYPYLEGRMFNCLEEYLPFSELKLSLVPLLLKASELRLGVGCGLAPVCALYPFDTYLQLPTKDIPSGKEVSRKYSDNSISEYKIEDLLQKRVKPPFCKECVYSEACYGIPSDYKVLFNDLRPIGEEDVRRRKERQHEILGKISLY